MPSAGKDIAHCCIFRPLSLPIHPFVCTFRAVVAVVVDLDVLPGLVARVAAELVIVGPHRAGVVVVAPEDCARITTPLWAASKENIQRRTESKT